MDDKQSIIDMVGYLNMLQCIGRKLNLLVLLDNHLVLLLDIRPMDMDIILMRCTCWCHTFSWFWSTCSTTYIPIGPATVAPQGFPKGQQDLSLPHLHENHVAPDVWEGEVEKNIFIMLLNIYFMIVILIEPSDVDILIFLVLWDTEVHKPWLEESKNVAARWTMVLGNIKSIQIEGLL